MVTIGNGNRNLDPNLLESVFDNIDGIEEAEKARKLSFWEDAELFRYLFFISFIFHCFVLLLLKIIIYYYYCYFNFINNNKRCREGNMALAVKFHQHIIREGGQVLVDTTVTDIDISLLIIINHFITLLLLFLMLCTVET